jgi:hypothetical protein
MKTLEPFILKTATYSKAWDLEDDYDLILRDKLKKLFSQGLEKEIHGPLQLEGSQADHYLDAFKKLINEVNDHHKILLLAGIEPGADADQIDPQKIDEMILRCHHLNKERASNQQAEISLADILGRSTSQSPESDNDKQSTDSQPERSPEELQVIDRLATICGGNNPEEIESWRKLISDKVKFEDLVDWEHHGDEEIRKIGRLMHGDMAKGLRDAIRIVDQRVDDRTTISFMKNYCIASGGRWEHIDGSFRVVVDKGSAFDRERINRQLCDALEGTPEHEPIKEALKQNTWKLTDGELAGLNSLGKARLKKVLPCLLHDS